MIKSLLKKAWDLHTYSICVTSKYMPIRHPTGLFKLGAADENSPVFVSGDYYQTVIRLLKILKKHDCYLLVVDSAGINVWCAAGVGDFNEHKVADAVNTYEVQKVVNHRRLILPQLGAVGINRKKLFEECGFHVKWGPANLQDLDDYINNNTRTTEPMRRVRACFTDRLYIAIGMIFTWLFIYALVYIVFALIVTSAYNHLAYGAAILSVISIMSTVLYPALPFKWITSKVIFTGAVILAVNILYFLHSGPELVRLIPAYIVINISICFLLCIDMLGSSVEFKTTILHWLRTNTNRALFQPKVTDACNGCSKCVDVCPKRLFSFKDKQLSVDYSQECNECLACIKQCSEGAIENLNRGVWKNDIKALPDDLVSRRIL
jgi:NAD-dependent dihydropyrimidine dehydrogenase PreA subunit